MPDTRTAPIARSPIAAAAPVRIVGGWEVSGARSGAPLRLADWTAMAKVLLRAPRQSAAGRALNVAFGRSRRDEYGVLVVGSGPTEWLLLGEPGTASAVMSGLSALQDGAHASVVDVTHGRALVRVTGADAARMLAKVGVVASGDLLRSDATTPEEHDDHTARHLGCAGRAARQLAGGPALAPRS